jgi:lysozyme
MTVLALSLATATAARATTPSPGAGAVRGIDVSAYQHAHGAIKWPLVARAGIRFVAIKASEGTYYTNPYYASDAKAATAAGLAVVAYVFANPAQSSGAATARFGIAAAHYSRGTRLPLEVDLESDPYSTSGHPGACYGLSARRMIAWIAGFSAQTVALTGKPPIIYTSALWWKQCTGDTGQFRQDPLWVPAYLTAAPGLPSPWTQWTFWQYDNHTGVPGVAGVGDVDFYHPTSALPGLFGQPVKPAHQPGHTKKHPGHHPRSPRKPPSP